MQTGIRELRNNLSRYLRQIEAGDRIAVTSHGRIVAEIVPPAMSRANRNKQFNRLVSAGIIRPAMESGDPLEDWPDIRLPLGTAAGLIDNDRGEE